MSEEEAVRSESEKGSSGSGGDVSAVLSSGSASSARNGKKEKLPEWPRVFTDGAGKTWEVRISVGTIKRLKANGIDLSKLTQFDEFQKFVSDVESIMDTVYLIVLPEAEKEGIGPEAFAERFESGDTIVAVRNAFIEAWLNFGLPAEGRAVFRRALGKAQRLASKALGFASEALDNMDEDAQANEAFEQALSKLKEQSLHSQES